MGVLGSSGLFAGGVVLLVLGGEVLVRGAVGLAERFSVKPLSIGMTIVAFGTSAPELALNLAAAVSRNTGLAFGNMVGASLANVGWVLGLLAVLRPVKVEAMLVRRELPLLLGGVALLVALAYAPPEVEGRAGLTRWDGLLLVAAFAGVLTVMVRAAQAPAHTRAGAELREEFVELAERTVVAPLGRSVVQVVGGLVLLAVGGKLGEVGAVGLATALGLSQELVGLTVVSFATTLPELATSLLAARRGQGEMALGNVVGSNLFNLLFILGSVALVTDVPLPPDAWMSFAALVGLTVLLFPMSISFDWTITRPEGALLMVCYLGFIGSQVVRAVAIR
jgi:cation:H+ antiporter